MKSLSALFFLTASSALFCVSSHAHQLQCGLGYSQQYLPGLPDFNLDNVDSDGGGCNFISKTSSRTGSWFPTLPSIQFWQGKGGVSLSNSDDTHSNRLIKGDIPIRRLDRSTFYIAGLSSQWEQIVSAKKNINFRTPNGSDLALANQQDVIITREELGFSVGLKFPYRSRHPLTQLSLSKYIIDQPIQANVQGQMKRSLYNSTLEVYEVAIASDSHHRGLNINWQLGFGSGTLKLGSEAAIPKNDKLDEVMSFSGRFDLFYRWRFNMRWHSYVAWQNSVRTWLPVRSDSDELQLPSGTAIDSRIQSGILIKF